MLGADTMLPCRVSPVMNVENMELRWFRSQFSEAVFVYQDGMEQVGEQLVDFKGRAELVKDYITEGRVGVRIHSLRVSDNGMYKCFFKQGNDFEEAVLELKVIGLGSGPHILMVGPEDEGIKVTCRGKGWFPQPEVQWRNEEEKKIPSLSETEVQDDDGLFQIETSLIVRDSSKRKVACSMKNPFFGEEQVETISIPEPFFPRTSPWKVAFAVTLPILLASLGAVSFLIIRRQKEKKKLLETEEENRREKKATESLKNELDKRKKLYQQEAVTLAPDTAHPNLKVSENGKYVWIEDVPQDCETSTHPERGDGETIYSVLGQNRFTTGKHFWEVEVKMGAELGTRWALGVCSDTVKRKGWFVESPEKNFWVVAFTEGEVKALISNPESLSLRQQPHKIGIFLDWEAGDVSFYNMLDGSHIYSFTGITFCGNLHPYFSLQGSGTSVTICSASEHTENCSSSPSKVSVTYTRNNDGRIPQEADSLLPA
ncbi:butyrophilin subfamily 1 member A1-like [Rhynchocyon petersi]